MFITLLNFITMEDSFSSSFMKNITNIQCISFDCMYSKSKVFLCIITAMVIVIITIIAECNVTAIATIIINQFDCFN